MSCERKMKEKRAGKGKFICIFWAARACSMTFKRGLKLISYKQQINQISKRKWNYSPSLHLQTWMKLVHHSVIYMSFTRGGGGVSLYVLSTEIWSEQRLIFGIIGENIRLFWKRRGERAGFYEGKKYALSSFTMSKQMCQPNGNIIAGFKSLSLLDGAIV